MASLARPSEDSIPSSSNPPPPSVTTTDNGYSYGSFPAIPSDTTITTTASPSSNNAAAAAPSKTRVLAPDLLRGLLMMIMAFDHLALGLHTWSHGTNTAMESDGVVVHTWNRPVAYFIRTLTHLCGTGFTMLLGMGVVYLGRSRTKLGWSAGRLAWYFLVRCLVLTGVSVVFGLVVSGGRLWFMNAVLWALAVDYLLAGLLWLGINATEGMLSRKLTRWLSARQTSDDITREPLLSQDSQALAVKDGDAAVRAHNISWHMHNGLLVILALVTIWWNHWFSLDGGHCPTTSDHSLAAMVDDFSSMSDDPAAPVLSTWQILTRIWLYPVTTPHIMSGFPPLAWVSFSILGLLYGRLMTSRPWNTQALAMGHALAAAILAVFFLLTRLLRFGNLSDGCLHTPENDAHPHTNPYLVSPQAFFYVIKYPPDVAYWALTLSGTFLLLGIFGAIPVRIARRFTILLDFGTSALFYYVAHMFIVFGVASAMNGWFGHDTGIRDPMSGEKAKGIDNIAAYFAIWALCMLILWPLCRWYSRFKSTKSADSLWRFF
jgi:uncharacterized membrane protein